MEFDIWTVVSLVLLSILIGLCQAGGIGGGPIISPIMMFLLSFGQRKAVWNTFVMMFGGSIGTYMKLSGERLQSTGGPLINYRLVLVTLPLQLSSAIIGVALGKSLPKVMIATFLMGVLISVIKKTSKVYTRVREIEKKGEILEPVKEHQVVELIPIQEKINSVVKDTDFTQKEQPQPAVMDQLLQKETILMEIYEKEKVLFPRRIMIHMALQALIVILIMLIKGSKNLPSFLDIEFCSLQYHLCSVALFIIGYISVIYYNYGFNKEDQYKDQNGYDWNREPPMKNIKTMKASIVAGLLGGFVGLGGGTILTPVWLELGIPAPRAAASATLCVMFTSFISMIQIVIAGGYEFEEWLVFMIVSCIGSYNVASYLKYLQKKYKRDSITILVLLGVVAMGIVILPVNTYLDLRNGGVFEFNRFC